jgi:uncharacterized protein YndB with AHSA1/START domain
LLKTSSYGVRVKRDDAQRVAVVEEELIAAPSSAVWRALVDGAHRRRWWSYLELDPVVGGRFTERWAGADGEEMVTTGSVLEVTEGRLLRLTWSDADWPAETEVVISVTSVAAGTLVRVQHAGFERLPDGQRLAQEHAAGWQVHLSNLRSITERGSESADVTSV